MLSKKPTGWKYPSGFYSSSQADYRKTLLCQAHCEIWVKFEMQLVQITPTCFLTSSRVGLDAISGLVSLSVWKNKMHLSLPRFSVHIGFHRGGEQHCTQNTFSPFASIDTSNIIGVEFASCLVLYIYWRYRSNKCAGKETYFEVNVEIFRVKKRNKIFAFDANAPSRSSMIAFAKDTGHQFINTI